MTNINTLEQEPIITLGGSGIVDINWNPIWYQPGYNVRLVPIADPWIVNHVIPIPVLKENIVQSNIICYTNDSKFIQASSFHKYIERNTDSQMVLVTSWQELVVQIGYSKPTTILFHTVEVEPERSYHEFVSNVERLCMRLPKKINIGAVIGYEDTAEHVRELQACNITGIVPNPEHFGIDATVEAVKNIMVANSHWPNDIIACLGTSVPNKKPRTSQKKTETSVPPELHSTSISTQSTHGDRVSISDVPYLVLADKKTMPNIIYFRDDHTNSKTCTAELATRLQVTWACPTTWEQLTHALECGHRLVATHIEMIEKSGSTVTEFVNMINSLVKFMPNNDQLKVSVVITKNTNIKIVKELQRTSVTGILLDINEFTIDDISDALSHMVAGKSYWPKHILSQLPGNRTTPTIANTIRLTARQEQIATLICQRGLSNKKVANMLTITESTVKAHVSAILKAYGVRNRTQLVLSAVKENRA